MQRGRGGNNKGASANQQQQKQQEKNKQQQAVRNPNKQNSKAGVLQIRRWQGFFKQNERELTEAEQHRELSYGQVPNDQAQVSSPGSHLTHPRH